MQLSPPRGPSLRDPIHKMSARLRSNECEILYFQNFEACPIVNRDLVFIVRDQRPIGEVRRQEVCYMDVCVAYTTKYLAKILCHIQRISVDFLCRYRSKSKAVDVVEFRCRPIKSSRHEPCTTRLGKFKAFKLRGYNSFQERHGINDIKFEGFKNGKADAVSQKIPAVCDARE